MPADPTRPPPPPPPPALPRRPLVFLDRSELRRRELQREIRTGPRYLLLALLAHAAFFVWWATRPFTPPPLPREEALRAALDEPPPETLPAPEPTPPPELPPDVLPPDAMLVDAPVETEASTLPDLEPRSAVDILGLGGGAGGGGAGRRSALAGTGAELVTPVPGGSGFHLFVDELRARGLDVVFLVDATASMDRFIALARATIDGIIADLATVVPDLRLGIVAYRDVGDPWITRKADLTDNRYDIHNFLLDLTADGGGDFPEAVQEGLRVAIQELSWRPESRRVLILVGDAPPHQEDENAAQSLVRGFARDRQAALSVLYTGGSGLLAQSERDAATRAVFERLVRTGGGLLAELGDSHGDLQERILDASFGTEWSTEIRGLLAGRSADRRARIVRGKVAERDLDWLRLHLGDDPPHPAVVDGCVELFDRGVAQRALSLLSDESHSLALRSAALFVLKKSVAPGVELDLTQPLAAQEQAMARLRREVERLSGGPTPPVPPPPPPPGG